jgi:hypothetical protein
MTRPAQTVTLDGDTYAIEPIARETFDAPDWEKRWAVEGNSRVTVEDGKLFIRRPDLTETKIASVWYRPDLPADVFVRFRCKAIDPVEENAANFNVFLHAREPDGRELRFGRSGRYDEYHKIPNYIVTLVGGVMEGWSRVRRDPGFHLLHEANARSEVGREYDIAVTVVGGRIRWYLDGKRLHDVTDPDPLPGGKFAIRTYNTDGWWDDVTFARVVSVD